MKSARLVATSVLAISFAASLAASGTASANGYLGLAVGTKPSINDGLESVASPFGRSLRGLAGLRFGNVSLEGAVNGFDAHTSRGDQTLYQASASLKLSFPLSDGFEAFGRAGVERTWLSLDDDRYNLEGDGFVLGGGVELRINALISNASLFVDYTVHRVTLKDTRDSVDATAGMFGLGFTLGF